MYRHRHRHSGAKLRPHRQWSEASPATSRSASGPRYTSALPLSSHIPCETGARRALLPTATPWAKEERAAGMTTPCAVGEDGGGCQGAKRCAAPGWDVQGSALPFRVAATTVAATARGGGGGERLDLVSAPPCSYAPVVMAGLDSKALVADWFVLLSP